MKKNTLKELQSLLLNRRREMLEQVAHLEFEREELGQHFIESIDSAQKENLARLIHKLDERGKEEIEEIELALTKMSSGKYGICEICGKSIPITHRLFKEITDIQYGQTEDPCGWIEPV